MFHRHKWTEWEDVAVGRLFLWQRKRCVKCNLCRERMA